MGDQEKRGAVETSPASLTAEHAQGSGPQATHQDLPLATKGTLEDASNTAQPTGEAAKKDKDARPGLANFWRLLAYSTTLDRCFMALAALCSFAAGATLPLMILVFGRIVADFTGYFIPETAVTKSQFLATVNQNALYIVYLFIAKFALGYVSIYSFRITGIRISAKVRMVYLTRLFNQPVAAIDKLPAGAATDSLTTAANTIQLAVSDKLGLLCQAIALLISAYAVAFSSSWSLTLVSSSVILFIFIVYGGITPTFFKLENSILESQTSASAVANEVFRAIRTVKSLGAERSVTARYARWIEQARKTGLKKSPVTGLQFAPAYFAIYANMALSFWFGVKLFIWNDIPDNGTIVTVLFSVLIVTSALGMIFAPMQAIYKAASASGLLFKVIDAPVLKEGGLKAPEADSRADISFDNVHFTYPSRPHTEVLKGLDLRIPTGKVTALVGPSGCGKSTIVALLERWYELSYINEELKLEDSCATGSDESTEKSKKTKQSKSKTAEKSKDAAAPVKADDASNPAKIDAGPTLQNDGSIKLGTHSLEDLDRKWWRAQIGLVQQEPFLFNETVHENVGRGLIGSDHENAAPDEKLALVQEACREAFADDFIRLLPSGYNTMVGEAGIKLSGGQRQRLAIARSIIKRPAILILDEATSAIDVRSEKIVEAALERASRGRTTITIAHRLSTIRKADHIVVLKNGVSVEEGTHEQLLERPEGIYSGLVQAQQLEIGGTDGTQDDAQTAQTIAGDADAQLELARSKSTQSVKPVAMDEKDEQTSDRQRGFIRSVGRLLYEQRQHRIIYTFICLGALGGGAAYAIQAWLLTQVITVFTESGSRLVSQANFWSLMLFVLSLGVGICYALIGYFTNSLSVHVSTVYRQRYFESMLNKSIAWYDEEDHSSGSLTAKLSGDPQQLQEILGPNMALPLVAIFNIVGCTIISFVFGWKLTLVVFFSSLPVIIGASFLRIRYELEFEKLNAAVFADSSKFAAESISAFRTVAALTMEDAITGRYARLLDDQIHKAFKKGRLSVLVFALSDSLELCCMALAFWYGGQLLASREYNIDQFFIIYIAIVQGGQAAGQFIAFGPNVAQATSAANRILAIRDEKTGASASLAEQHARASDDGMEVEFREVGFKYPLREASVYKKLSFQIGRGEYVAFVGPSGCGKTTVISLLERFYAPTAGQILVDRTDLTDMPMAEYRTACALVSQEPTLFEGTVRENLVMGLRDTPAQQDIEAACKAAEIFDFIVSLPQAFDTPLSAGTHASLSGGQKQRLCIARALLRRPRLLLLDEATSSLDSQSERLVQKAIEQVASGNKVTIVVVAHRLATVKNADRIIVLGDGGRILEEGGHAQLLKRRGAYWNMCQAQALDR